MARIPVSLITGFLGSGKTTLLNRLLSQPDLHDVAVIINEFGEIGLDHQLVESADDTVIELKNGCLCCTIRGDLVDTLRDLYHRRTAGDVPKFRKAVIETTGLADPAPVIQVVLADPMVNHVFELDGVVTTVDALLGDATLDEHDEAVRQVAVADRIVVTKVDLCDDVPRLEALKGRLARLNPAAPILDAVKGDVAADLIFGAGLYDPGTKIPDVQAWLNEAAYERDHDHAHGHAHDVNRHDDRIRAYAIEHDAPITLRGLEMFLEGIAGVTEGKLLRIKGIVHVAERPDEPAVVQGAQNVFHGIEWLSAWPDDNRSSRIVFITRDLAKAEIEETWALVERMTGA
ncbi:MAG: GTP-binding protein [Alphaproteobacteria bacterium]|nr:GTP-binding protein [Alphaproteobacteria bacterium]MCZ6764786.1 GTP-binding protein [Alphaproteobacteria bacterium]